PIWKGTDNRRSQRISGSVHAQIRLAHGATETARGRTVRGLWSESSRIAEARVEAALWKTFEEDKMRHLVLLKGFPESRFYARFSNARRFAPEPANSSSSGCLSSAVC